MKKSFILLIALGFLLSVSCNSDKGPTELLTKNLWELEYISGPKIAFKGLFPDKRPQLRFDPGTGEVSGNAGCNGYSAKYVLVENKITFGEPGPTTMMYCGQGEPLFLKAMGEIDGYRIDEDGNLNLLKGNETLMKFKKMER